MINIRRPHLQRWSPHGDARELNHTMTNQGWTIFEGTTLVWAPGRLLKPGDTCLAANGNGVLLLTVLELNHRTRTVRPAEDNIPELPVNLCYRVELP